MTRRDDTGRLDPRRKITGRGRLLEALRAARRAGRRIVFTNGVFDMLHPGHVRLLSRARALGDLLVVGLNSDSSARRLKGQHRPFLPQRERALMLAALESVDYVVVFGQDTPLSLIRSIGPDVLIKGSDWSAAGIVGSDMVKARGGRVVRVALHGGFSTTRLAARIARAARRP